MRKTPVIIITLVLTVLFFASNSFAIGLGLYFDIGTGSGEAEFDFQGADEFDIDTKSFGLGFQIESNPLSAKGVFSYRFQAGLEAREMETDDNVTMELGGLVFNNTFAFGGNPSEKIRLWGGPQLLIGFYFGETEKEYLGDEISFGAAAFGLGVAGGANFGLGKTILTSTIGVRTLGLSGEAEWHGEDEDLDGSTTEFFFSVGILF